jgi:type II secretory pathway component PulF
MLVRIERAKMSRSEDENSRSTSFPTFRRWLLRCKRLIRDAGNVSFGKRSGRSNWRIVSWWSWDREEEVQLGLLRILAIAQRETLPVAELVQAYADEHRGVTRFRLRRLSKRLRDQPVISALEQTPHVISADAMLALRVGHHQGMLPQVYELLKEQGRHCASYARGVLWQSFWYMLLVITACLLVVFFMKQLIAPTFVEIREQIFDRSIFEQDGEVAAAWQYFQFPAESWLAGLGLVVLSLVVLELIPTLRRKLVEWGSRLFGLFGQHRQSQLLRLFALAKQAGRPIPGTMSVLGRYHADATMRRRLLYARNEVEQGVDIWESLVRADIISAEEAKLIEQGSASQLEAWVLEQLADRNRRHRENRLSFWAIVAQPFCVLLVGAFVYLVTTRFFIILRGFVEFSIP